MNDQVDEKTHNEPPLYNTAKNCAAGEESIPTSKVLGTERRFPEASS